MIKRFFDKINKKLKEKKGASLLIVVIAMSMLVVMGTIFSNLAYQSYKHSYGNICQQQANYTAKGLLDMFIEKFQKDTSFRKQIGDSLLAQVGKKESADVNVTEAIIDIKQLHSYNPETNAFIAQTNKDDCKLKVSKYEKDPTKVKLTVVAKYKGFASSLSAILGYTNKAALELGKIMNNALYITSPIADMMYYAQNENDYFIDGDVYVDAPIGYDLPVDDPKYPYSNISSMPNIIQKENTASAFSGEAFGGHTLEMDIDGRSTLNYNFTDTAKLQEYYEKTSPGQVNNMKLSGTFLTPKIDADGKLSYLYNANGEYIPLVNKEGKVQTRDGTVFKTVKNENVHFEIANENAFEIDPNVEGKYAIEYEPLRDTVTELGTTSGKLKFDAMGNPIYLQEMGNNVPARRPIDGLGFDGKYSDFWVNYPYIYNNLYRKSSNEAEQNAKYMIYKCEYQDVEYKKDADGSFVLDEDGNKIVEKYLNSYKTKLILGEKQYLANSDGSPKYEGIPEGYEAGVWYRDPKFGYGREVNEPFQEWRDGRDLWHFSFKGGEETYPIQRFQRVRATTTGTVALPAYRYVSTPAKWTEVYLRSHYGSEVSLTGEVPIVINGKLKCNTSVLLGLYNRGIEGDGYDHEFKIKKEIKNTDGTVSSYDKIVPVAFDTPINGKFNAAKDRYNIPKYTCLRTSDDIYVNGNVRGENLICGGTLYAIDNNPEDDKTDAGYSRDGCTGNVVLEQMTPVKKVLGIPVSLTSYMEVAKNNDIEANKKNPDPNYKKVDGIVADGYVCVVGGVADISAKALIYGDIRAGKYDADGNIWGPRGSGEEIPADKYYREDGSKTVAQDLKGKPFPAGIYGYSTGTVEEKWGKKNRYTLGSGDVVLQKTRVWGDVYATGDVYINNGTNIYGNIYTPGNVYITKGETGVFGTIGSKFDGRCRVFGSIYAGGNVSITGGCEVGDWQANVGEDGYDSGIYCGGNLYIRGRINNKNHDVVPGNVYVGGNLTVIGRKAKVGNRFTRIGYNGGNIIVGGNIGSLGGETGGTGAYTTALGCKDNSKNNFLYCGGNLKLDNLSAIEEGIKKVYVKGLTHYYGCWIHAKKSYIEGDLKIEGDTRYYSGMETYLLGNQKIKGFSTLTPWNLKLYQKKGSTKEADKFDRVDLSTSLYNNDGFISSIIPTISDNLLKETDKNIRVDNLNNAEYKKIKYSVKVKDKTTTSGTGDNKKEYTSYKYVEEEKEIKGYFAYYSAKPVLEKITANVEQIKPVEVTLSAIVRKWSAPKNNGDFYADKQNNIVKTNKADGTQEALPDNNKAHIIGFGGDNTYQTIEELTDGKKHYIVKDNLMNVLEINLKPGDILTFDTTKKNLHIKVSGNINIEGSDTINGGATIRVNGPNMANIYMEGINSSITIGKNCNVGKVIGVPVGVSEKSAGLNIISNEEVTMTIGENAVVRTYNYIPKGALKFVIPKNAKVNPEGSYVINRLVGNNLEAMRYWSIKFTTKSSPLIMDSDNNFGDGDYIDQNGNSINDFGEIEWQIIKYE